MIVTGTWSDLIMLRQRVELIDITGFRITVPAIGSKENKESFPSGSANEFSGPDTMIERLVIHNSLLDIMRVNGKRLSFPIKQVEIQNLHKSEALTYAVDMQNPIPHGHILARGTMGPINGKAFASTPLRGNFAFTQVNLHDVGEISGTLDSRGLFNGTLQSMIVEASEETKDFAVKDGKPTPVEGTMKCVLDGSNGDMDIQAIDLKIRESQIHASGSIEGNPKKTNLDISVDRGRAEDIMRPFIHDEVPIVGPVSLKSHAYLGPPGDGFIQRLRLSGGFNVPAEKVTNKDAEKSLSAFSQRAQGKQGSNTGVESNEKTSAPDKDELSSIQGPAKIENGVVSTSQLRFRIAGAQALLAGTLRFHDKFGAPDRKPENGHRHLTHVHWIQIVPAQAARSLFKKKNAGAVLPIAVTGLPGHYKISHDITHTK